MAAPGMPKQHHFFRNLIGLFAVLCVLIGASVFAGYEYVQYEVNHNELPALTKSEDSVVLADNGKVLTVIPASGAQHSELTQKQIPELVKMAVLGAEDHKFFDHGAVFWPRMLLALISSRGKAGGSTITQQYVKVAYTNRLRTLERKHKEIVYAYRLEKDNPGRAGKEKILTLYLNAIYYGRGATGIADAAQAYFGESATKLKDNNDPKQVSKAATLAGFVRSPCYYGDCSPDKPAFNETESRRNAVIDGMAEIGAITPDVAGRAKAIHLTKDSFAETWRSRVAKSKVAYPFISDYASRFLGKYIATQLKGSGVDDDKAAKQGQDEAQALLAQGGLVIKTDLNANLQKALTQAALDNRPNRQLQVGAVIQGGRGAIKAMVGGVNYGTGKGQSQYNLATMAYDPQLGSTMKVALLTNAVKNGYSPKKSYLPDPAYIVVNGKKVWNDDKKGDLDNKINWVQAIAKSSNTFHMEAITGRQPDPDDPSKTVPIEGFPTDEINPGSTLDLAYDLGLDTTLYPGEKAPKPKATPSITLGTNGATPAQLAELGSTLAEGGQKYTQYVIKEIIGADGTQLYKLDPSSKRIISSDAANVVNQALTHVITEGTGQNTARISGYPTAGKTGTTDTGARMVQWSAKNRSQQPFVCSVWMGYLPVRDTNGGLWGADTANVCRVVLKKALSSNSPIKFPAADESGLKPLTGLEGPPTAPTAKPNDPPTVEPTATPTADDPTGDPTDDPTAKPSNSVSPSPSRSRHKPHGRDSNSDPASQFMFDLAG